MTQSKRRFMDRSDGRRIKSIDPFFRLIPYIMETRMDSQVFFEEEIDLENIDKLLRVLKDNGSERIGLLHVLMAATVRTISQKPGLNRFIAGQKIYARNSIALSLAVKKEMTEESPETTIKLECDPKDTIHEIAEKLNKLIAESKSMESSNDTDKTAAMLARSPGVILKNLVRILKIMDYHGKLPKSIHQASPFHSSVFITDLGSLGIKSVYHHLYEFGTTSMFISFGTRQRKKVLNENNEPVEKKFIIVKIVCDERIVDGMYYAKAFKLFCSLMKHPEKLLNPPEKVYEDIQ